MLNDIHMFLKWGCVDLGVSTHIRMKTTIVIFLIISILTPLISFSNGGPVDYSHFRKTGNIRLLRKADVSLIKENLTIKVVGDFSEIEVEYSLKNNGKSQKIL